MPFASCTRGLRSETRVRVAMRGFGRIRLWRAVGTHPVPALSGTSLRDWLRWRRPVSASARAAAAVLIAALVATAALFGAVRLQTGGVSARTEWESVVA